MTVATVTISLINDSECKRLITTVEIIIFARV